MKKYRQKIGAYGEKLAERHLKNKGYLILAKNFRLREGEIDLVTRYKTQIAFVEVKTRTSSAYGQPEEAIDQKKRNKYQAVAEKYLEKSPYRLWPWHFEVICIRLDKKRGRITFRHLTDL